MLETNSQYELLVKLKKKVQEHKKCLGTGKMLDQESKLVNCECLDEALYQFRLSQSGIPPKYRALGFKDYIYKDGEAFKKIQDYLQQTTTHREQGMGLFLYGPSYTGKSLLACSLLMETMRQGYSTRFVYFNALLDDKGLLQAVKKEKADFLCVDGVSDVLNRASNFKEALLTGERTHYFEDVLSQVLSNRVSNSLPVIVTSEVSLADLNKHFPGIVNTLIGNCLSIQCEDKGFRQKRLDLMMGDDK